MAATAERVTHVLRTEAEYMAAVAEVDRLLEENAPAGTPDYDRLELLAVLIEAYDDRHYPVARTTPQKVVDFMLSQKEMTRAELAPVLGGRSRVSEFFAKKRRLSITQIKRIRDLLDIPADLLIS
jgi:HTH-type transcriptional regulator / antitoxin HigA